MKIFRVWILASISLLLILAQIFPIAGTTPAIAQNLSEYTQPFTPEDVGPRRANIPYFENNVSWARSAIFWFGINEQGLPGKNYADVRLAYTAQAFQITFTVVDYYLWLNPNPQSGDDLSQYDALAIYLDTNNDSAQSPQSDDFKFLLGIFNGANGNNYQREARGTGSAWDENWTGSWSAVSAPSWSCDPGINDNDCTIDYGWIATFTIPWTSIGYTGPPTEGDLWGLGIQLFDRDDQPPAGAVAPEFWPETFQANSPASWGEIHFGENQFVPPARTPNRVTTIRANSPTDNTVEDAWMGGGGHCAGGHEGGSETNHGADEDLYTGSEILPTHFPCYNKSFLRFQIDSIPAGVEIISATLTLHLWGNADQTIAPPYSYVHLFTVHDDWDEMTIHWNNAPLAQENISATKVYPYEFIPPIWPGEAYTWEASQAVADSVAAGQPVNLALYNSDTGRDTSKYFTSSEVGDWDAVGRPTLKIYWWYDDSNLTEKVYLPLIKK